MSSDYERQRQANIRANMERLAMLGLAKGPVAASAAAVAGKVAAASPRAAARRNTVAVGEAPSPAETAPGTTLRRSSRSRTSTLRYEPEQEDDVQDERKPAAPRTKQSPKVKHGGESSRPSSSSSSGRSCKDMMACVETLQTTWLGRQLPLPAVGAGLKTAVMALVAGTRSAPAFPRLSGVQQWKNAVCLFVNLDGNTYDNTFSQAQGGFAMTWFASAQTNMDSPVIQRLLKAERYDLKNDDSAPSRQSTEAGLHKPEVVLLFCRLLMEPYVYCGRLALVWVDPKTSPLKFTWFLKDSSSMMASCPDFQAMLPPQLGGTRGTSNDDDSANEDEEEEEEEEEDQD
ncbi:hypothetical protein CAOG_05448 [Capsaspora owczarzaki ATCC 30864]|uniref:Uncharacterized protein n=1 Tax=Capsaspora owczarzaki (strain ATCC 30864) TaxID=595528 RepID=A0A0D2WS31_CAPO3|nr:hypothetical protein CAOG_05448 [Capsaspora owczarzaki ATCC 30864]KJE94890.1 hypothetical protein CAOG_005448 [Capsaspora owczarzaki ATCC 30864]|eukprot:XP_004346121.1 hypothetical protein CAOG_05448 [Capsaspora owczarzaki ATCC 30864]